MGYLSKAILLFFLKTHTAIIKKNIIYLEYLIFQVLSECKETAAKKRRQSTRLENLGIPEEELLRQQQELFAKARQDAVMQEQQLAAAAFNTPQL